MENIQRDGSLLTAEHWKALPSYVRELMNTHDVMEDLFLFNNPRFLTKYVIERLPTFGTKEDDGEYWHGRLFWRFVGWNKSKKYTGEDLREIRSRNGVGGKRV